jgi:hypothetical protein
MSVEQSTCRAEILESFRALEQRRGRDVFSVAEILAEMKARGTRYPESTIRTQVCSHMCVDAPDNAAVTYPITTSASRRPRRWWRSRPGRSSGTPGPPGTRCA